MLTRDLPDDYSRILDECAAANRSLFRLAALTLFVGVAIDIITIAILVWK